ncbi:MAG: Crp/Fnr family transcriptional regulator [Gammaproteobacteria bacterium]|nr:MAG: Crp/Fnr family transcriptional regulator [Gammaproteobacteria bacterium]
MERDQAEAILSVLQQLSAADKAAVHSFAEFLAQRAGRETQTQPQRAAPVPVAVPSPEAIPRPDNEKVVAAVKRLSKTYFMLDKTKMLGVTSDLVTQHIVQGRDAADVIDELERLFEAHYRELKQSKD